MTAPVIARASAEIAAEIEGLQVERNDLAARLAELENGYSAVLLNESDKAAERHEAETAKVRRALARADLRLPMLRDELAAAEAREEAERLAEKQAAATAAVDAVLADIEAEYNWPAKRIAAFLARWQAAAAVASEAGIPGPDQRIRIVPGKVHPAHDEVTVVWIDHNGVEQTTYGLPGPQVLDPKTGQMVPQSVDDRAKLAAWRKIEKRCHVPERREPDVVLPPLTEAVKLPGAWGSDQPHWPLAPSGASK